MRYAQLLCSLDRRAVLGPEYEGHVWHQWVDCNHCGISFPRRFDSMGDNAPIVVITCMNCTSKSISITRWATAEDFETWDWSWENRISNEERAYLVALIHSRLPGYDGIELRQLSNRLIPGLRYD